MEVLTFDDARAFRETADTLLLQDEAANNLILGVSGMAMEHPDSFEGFVAWVVIEFGEPAAACIRTPPHNLIMGSSENDQAVRKLAHAVGALPGVVGVVPSIECFIASRRETAQLIMSQGIFELQEVSTPPISEGLSRPADPEEIGTIVDFRLAFEQEAMGRIDDQALARRTVERRLHEQSNRLGVWVHEVNGTLVSMSGHSGATPNGIRIGLVYTPPELRSRGYASNLVATQSQWLLENGHRFCFLYTDLSNPTSNAIYKRIGYRQVAKSAQYSFSASTG